MLKLKSKMKNYAVWQFLCGDILLLCIMLLYKYSF